MTEKSLFRVYTKPELRNSLLVVGWSEDAGKVGTAVIDYLNKKLGCQEFAEIEPEGFFPLAGVSVEDDVAQFPESKFYYCEGKNFASFKGNAPRSDWYKFLNSLLDVAEQHCQAKELYTIGGMVSLMAHTTPRQHLAIANSPQMRETLTHYDLATDMEYETPPGQRPTLNAFLLWVAKRRNISGASLWVQVPFYLAAYEDPIAWHKTIEFFDRRFGLRIDFRDIDEEIARQKERIAQVMNRFPELSDYIRRLESNLSLTDEEYEKLAKEVGEGLRKRD